MSGLRRVLSRLTAPPEELDAAALRDDTREAGCRPIVQCSDRSVVSVSGTLRSVTLRPRAGIPVLEAELFDGTGTLSLVWLGRRRIAGVEPGRRIIATGRVAQVEGKRVLFNPRYELRPGSAE